MVKLTTCILNLALLASGSLVGLDLVKVRGGELPVPDEKGKVVNRVHVDSFEASVYEITNQQWKPFELQFKKQIGTRILQSSERADEISDGPQNPTIGISWIEAIAFCNWLSAKDGLEPVYTLDGPWGDKGQDFLVPNVSWNRKANGYRLPTLAEWMYMATDEGKSTTKYAGSNNADEVAVFSGPDRPSSRIGKTERVGSKKPNRLGIFDLSGNAAEWCWDFYQKNYLRTVKQANPSGPEQVPWDEELFGKSTFGKYYKTARTVAGGNYQTTDKNDVMLGLWDSIATSLPLRTEVGIRVVRNAK